MKKILTSLLFSFTVLAIAQDKSGNVNTTMSIPVGYYNSATGTGYVLKTQLFNIINGHNDRGYGGLYTTYLTSDVDNYYEANGTMLDMYTENPTGTECEFVYGGGLQDDGTLGNAECERYNREHLVPQSVFGQNNFPMYSDAHFVVPSDKYVNAQRGDLPFSRVNGAGTAYSNGSKRGSNLNSGYSAGYTGQVFEPINEFKGDIARMLLYFATRYEDQVATWNYTMFNNTSNQVFTTQAINVLLTWHLNDPVSTREISRNDAVYARQNNRNPFIDHPEYAMRIWGSLLNTESFNPLNDISVFPNPSSDVVNISTAAVIDQIEVITINGQVLQQINNPAFENSQYTINNLPKGFYFLKLSSETNSVTKKVLIN
ncbi:endonuclease [Flavobacterium sp.]